MGKKAWRHRKDSGRYFSVLLAGSGLLCAVVPLGARAAIGDPALRLSEVLEFGSPATPAFDEDAGPDFRLSPSLELAALRSGPAAAPDAAPPHRLAELPMQLARALAFANPAKPVFREEKGAGVRLSRSLELGGVGQVIEPLVPSAPSPRLPSQPSEPPMRLAQALVPPGNPGRQLRSRSRYDWPLVLQPTRDMNMPGAAGYGRPRLSGGDPLAEPVPAPEIEDEGDPALARGPAKPAIAFAQPAAESGAEEEAKGPRWVIPPIRWLGSIGYTLRHNQTGDGTKTLDQLINTSIRGSSYIYAPWMATVSGDFGVVTGANTMSDAGSGSGESQSTRHTSLVGSGGLNLFPASRFPFNASFSRADSRVSGVALQNDYTDTRFGLRQSYRTEDGLQNASASFDRSTINVHNGRKDTVTALSGNYAVPIGATQNNVNARVSVSEREGTGEGTTLFTMNSSHSLTADNNLSLQAYSNYTDNTLRYSSGNRVTESRGQYLQLSTTAAWQPEFEDTEDLPLTLTGGLMYFGSRSGSESFSSQSQRVSGTVSANYRFSPNLSMNGSGTLSHFSSNGGQGQILGLVSSGINYAGDPLEFGNYSYNWNTGGNISWQGGGAGAGSMLFTSAQAGHSIGRNIVISPTDSVSISVSQSAAAFQNQSFGSSTSLTHSAMAGYRLGLGDKFNGSLTATLSDVITQGANAQHYQNLNLSANGFGQLSQRSSATINLSFNYSDQSIKNVMDSFGQPTNNQRMSLAGSASYNHVRFAGVAGLRYNFIYTADTTLRDARMFGDVNGQVDRARHSLVNRFDYRIGLLDLRLSATLNDMGGKKNALLFFQVNRQIGAY